MVDMNAYKPEVAAAMAERREPLPVGTRVRWGQPPYATGTVADPDETYPYEWRPGPNDKPQVWVLIDGKQWPQEPDYFEWQSSWGGPSQWIRSVPLPGAWLWIENLTVMEPESVRRDA